MSKNVSKTFGLQKIIAKEIKKKYGVFQEIFYDTNDFVQ